MIRTIAMCLTSIIIAFVITIVPGLVIYNVINNYVNFYAYMPFITFLAGIVFASLFQPYDYTKILLSQSDIMRDMLALIMDLNQDISQVKNTFLAQQMYNLEMSIKDYIRDEECNQYLIKYVKGEKTPTLLIGDGEIMVKCDLASVIAREQDAAQMLDQAIESYSRIKYGD